jgi:ERCC4-type nuclease
MFVSAAEPKSLQGLGTYSPLPEVYGSDFLISCPVGLVGIQRKEIHDLIASRADGRLARELAQMKQLDIGVLLVEGRLKWTTDGTLSTSRSKWTRNQHLGLLFSIQSTGIWVNSSDSITESREYLSRLEMWMMKEKHAGLNTRPKPTTAWGNVTDRDWGIHVIQSFDGIGPGVAGAIFDRFGVPLRWTVTKEDLESVAGVGPKRAAKMWRTLNGQG